MSLKRKAADIAAAEAKKPKANSSITSFFGPPKTNPSTSSTNPSNPPTEPAASAKFDKEKWIAGLSAEQKTLLKLEIETLHESWLAVLKDEITSKSFLDLKKFLKSEAESGKKIFPPSEDVYSWFVLFLSLPFASQKKKLMLAAKKVETHAPLDRKSSHIGPGPLPQPQPSPRPLLLRPPSHPRPAVPPKHLQSAEKRVSVFRTPAKQRRSADPLGRPRRFAAQHLPHCPRPRSKFPRRQRLGEVYAESHRCGVRQTYTWSGVFGLGQSGAKEVCRCQWNKALRAQERASQSVERAQGIRKFSRLRFFFAG